MPYIKTDDGVNLFYEETGSGPAVIFVHEYAGDYRSYDPQVQYFARKFRCIAYNARGYPPSEVPADGTKYSQYRARDDILAILNGLGIEKAHIVGISMGGFATLHFGLTYPERAKSLLVAGCGYGARADQKDNFQAECEATAKKLETEGIDKLAPQYAMGPTRLQQLNKDPKGWEIFANNLAEHSSKGAALTMRGVQKKRPSIYDLQDQLSKLTVPTLVMNGDEDEPCLDASLYLKRTIPSSALVLLPQTGHNLNLEEPAWFNNFLEDFLQKVDNGRWLNRDPRTLTTSILGMNEKSKL